MQSLASRRQFARTLAAGTVEGGGSDATASIPAAIEACQAAGGGRVVVPSGVFLTGPIPGTALGGAKYQDHQQHFC
jgi:polygalacturonase